MVLIEIRKKKLYTSIDMSTPQWSMAETEKIPTKLNIDDYSFFGEKGKKRSHAIRL